MVLGSRIEGGTHVLSAGVRKTIQSIKDIVGNHSDADIYVALKETNMDPNETAQQLLNQDPFHEVKRKRDRRKENSGYKGFVAAEPRKNSELVRMPVKYDNHSDHNARRGGYSRNAVSGSGQEFRVVRDNRANQSVSKNAKPVQSSTSTSEVGISNGMVKSNSAGNSGHQKSPVGRRSSQAFGITDSQPRHTKGAMSGGNDRKELLGEKRHPIPCAASRVQTKGNDPQAHSTNSSSSSIVGVYSSSLDPVHIPCLHSRSASSVGAIRREVGVVGSCWQASENSSIPSLYPSSSVPNTEPGREGHSRESTRSFNSISKSDQSSQTMAIESATPGLSVSRSFSSNQYGSRPHQVMGHQKAPQPSKEWKPKSSLKPSANGPGVIGTPAQTVSLPADNPADLKKEATQMQDNVSRLKISKNQKVIIATHIRISEADRCRLTFGSLGTELYSSKNSFFTTNKSAEELSAKPSGSVSVSAPESSGEEPADSEQLDMMNETVRSSESNSLASSAISDQQTEEKESSSPQNLDHYTDVGLVRDNSPSYAPESLQQQDTSELPSFSGYDPQLAYDMSYFRPMVDEAVRGPGLSSSQEVPSSNTTNGIPASTIAIVQQQQQQQQQQLAQMYPQLHVSHFANLIPYRQFLSPVYVPPMPVPGYSNNPAYPHPSNASSYLLVPGSSPHLTPSGLKYGMQQFKPVAAGSPTGFGNFTSPTGYALNSPGIVGSTAGHEESSRLKYKDSVYVPNPQAETSEIWINPRDHANLPSASYYNMPGQTAHAAYLPSHSSHAPFNAAAAAQSSHMQFPGIYHPSPQPAAIASPHHLGPAIGGNVGVGVAAPAPGAQVGVYQQPQFGHLNWTGNF